MWLNVGSGQLWGGSKIVINNYTYKQTYIQTFLWQTVWNWGLPDLWYEWNGEFSGQTDTRNGQVCNLLESVILVSAWPLNSPLYSYHGSGSPQFHTVCHKKGLFVCLLVYIIIKPPELSHKFFIWLNVGLWKIKHISRPPI